MKIAQLLGEDAERFAENHEPKKPPRNEEPNELQAMFAELEAMEAQQAKQQKADS